MAKIIWSPQSLADLEDIADYIAKDAPHYASSMIENVMQLVENLESFPQIGRRVPEVADENVREIFYKRFRIIYQLMDDSVEILTIVHSSRLLDL